MFEKKKLTLLFALFIVLALALVTSVGGEGNNSAAPIKINEVRYTHVDRFGLHEYFELRGAPGSSVDDLTYLVIDRDDGSDGIIVSVTELVGTIPADGYYLAVEESWVLGGNPDLITSFWFVAGPRPNHMLVRDFIGNLGDDLDFNNDGILDDAPPWSSLEDCLTLEGSFPGVGYCETANGPDGIFSPAHSYLCQDGWRIGSFYNFSFDTPGERNDVCYGGGQGQPNRRIDLTAAPGAPASFSQASMVVIIGPEWGDHPQFPGGPVGVWLDGKLPCLAGFLEPISYPAAARQFYSLYITTETVPRTRFFSFNSCMTGNMISALLRIYEDYDNQTLIEEDLVVEIMLEQDDGIDSNFVVMRGEDAAD